MPYRFLSGATATTLLALLLLWLQVGMEEPKPSTAVLPVAVSDTMGCADLGRFICCPFIMALGEPGMTSTGPAGAAVVTAVTCGAVLMLLTVLLWSTRGPAPAGSASGSMTLPPTGYMCATTAAAAAAHLCRSFKHKDLGACSVSQQCTTMLYLQASPCSSHHDHSCLAWYASQSAITSSSTLAMLAL